MILYLIIPDSLFLMRLPFVLFLTLSQLKGLKSIMIALSLTEDSNQIAELTTVAKHNDYSSYTILARRNEV